MFSPFESYSFQEFLKFSSLKVVLSRTLGLAGSLVCRGLCAVCAVCATMPRLVSFESYFSRNFSSFSFVEILSRIFFGVLIWKLLCSKFPEVFSFYCCFSIFSGFLIWFVFFYDIFSFRFSHVICFQVCSCYFFFGWFFRFSHDLFSGFFMS